ncbi:SRPBCC domain-containing protein [Staphylococcus succinus]|nr:SRPBCC domain-containing protein [Staphylococcus succinus]
MDIITKMQVDVPIEKVFEAFVNPNEIGGFWFSSSSSRWEAGKTITLEYKEYDAVLDIQVKAVHLNSQIEFTW